MNQHIDFFKPNTVKEAVEILQKTPGAVPVAGGTDLIVKFRNGILPKVTAFVDISGLQLDQIKTTDTSIVIDSGCTMSKVVTHPEIIKYFPALVAAASTVGAKQIRNSATLGGNVANSSPAGDTIPALYSLNAILNIVSPTGKRQVKIEEFFTGPGKNSLTQGELIESIELPKAQTEGVFIKMGERKAHAISKINIALSRSKNTDGKYSYKIAMGAVAPTVIRCPEAENFLESAQFPLSDEQIAQLEKIGRETAKPIDDVRSTARYRKQMAGVLLKRAATKLS